MQDISVNPEHDLSRISGLARAVQAVLTLKENSCLWAGVPCSTFIWLSRGTFKRSAASPWGTSTDLINCVVLRFVFVGLLAIVRRAFVIMEQPLSSTLRHLPPIKMLALLCHTSWGEARLLLDYIKKKVHIRNLRMYLAHVKLFCINLSSGGWACLATRMPNLRTCSATRVLI